MMSPPAAPDLRAVQERYASRIKARLARPALTIQDARDGVLDCFVATYYGGVAQGLQHVLGVRASDDEVAQVTAGLFRKKLRERGGSFDAPTSDALAEVKDEVDRELHVIELPPELRGVHDQVCSLLLAKADGLLPHTGDRPSLDPAVAPASGAGPVRSAPAGRPPASIARPPTTNGAASVTANLRGALAGWLRHLAERVDRGEPVDDIVGGLDRAHRLITMMTEFES